MSNMITDVFERLRERRELALIPYVTAGFPTLDASMEAVALIANRGADIIEIGIPFSDPVADGPTIQHASHVALQQGVRLAGVLDRLRGLRVRQPLVLMSYLNPLLAYSPACACSHADRPRRLFADMQEAGARGLIIPDLPPEEADPWLEAARAEGVSLIFLVAPTSSTDRIRRIAEISDAFLYYVSVTGTTGARPNLPPDLKDALKRVRSITDQPLVVGFGISQPEHIRSLREDADGVVVGSRIVDALRTGGDLAELITGLKEATIDARPARARSKT